MAGPVCWVPFQREPRENSAGAVSRCTRHLINSCLCHSLLQLFLFIIYLVGWVGSQSHKMLRPF
ncbi:hypothetical protein ES319_D05G225300v1 [Gossypium barbadense]|nr:hypothetical protein ES319_D05G225300v1 [Gossypium barbadense]